MPLRFGQLNLVPWHWPKCLRNPGNIIYLNFLSPLFSANRAVPAEHSQSTRRAQCGVWLPVGVCADLTHWGVLPAQHLPSMYASPWQFTPQCMYNTAWSQNFRAQSKRSLWKRIYCLNYFIKEHRYMRNTWNYKSCDTATLNIQR